MQHEWQVSILTPTRTSSRLATEVVRSLGVTDSVVTSDVIDFVIPQHQGHPLQLECDARSLEYDSELHTRYEEADALLGDYGILHVVPSSRNQVPAILSTASMDFTMACSNCSFGARQVNPHTMPKSGLRYKGEFYHGHPGTNRLLMRRRLADLIVDATGVDNFLRPSLLPDGSEAADWVDLVPTAEMPPLSTGSQGILVNASRANTDLGDPMEEFDPCPICKRTVWGYSYSEPSRLEYSRASTKDLTDHVVLSMREPFNFFPRVTTKTGKYGPLYGWPLLLLQTAAVEAIISHIRFPGPETWKGRQQEHGWVEPVYVK